MTLNGFKRDIEVEFQRVVDITLSQNLAVSRVAMMAIMRHELERLAEIRANWGDPHVAIDADGNVTLSEEVAAFANGLMSKLLGPAEA